MKPIEEMTGLELREAVAVEVMGWTRDEDGWDDHGRLVVDEPWFESSIEAAFAVVEKMRETVCMEMTCGEAGYMVEFTPYCGQGWGAFQSESLPLAICRAALKAARQNEA